MHNMDLCSAFGSSCDKVCIPVAASSSEPRNARRTTATPEPTAGARPQETLARRVSVAQPDRRSSAEGNKNENHRHYIAEAVEKQDVSIGYCARRMGISVEEAARQLDPHSNLTLEQLFAWSDALDVPLPELLPFDSNTSDPIRNRALLLRIMKTARQIENISVNTPVQYAAKTLVDQLIELIPEFSVIEAWPSVGKSRMAKSEGAACTRVDHETSRFIEDRY